MSVLVDDDDELREDMTRFFSRRGYRVSECENGEQALAFTDQRAFDVIVLDMEVDEALKMIISLGVVVPTWREDRLGELPLVMPENGDD